MDLSNAKTGDLAIFSDGTQALILNTYKTETGRYSITFEKEVTGWIGRGVKHRCWGYNRDGRFEVLGFNYPHIDIVKVVHND